MRVLVTGGRDYDDQQFVDNVLSNLHSGEKESVSLIIQGGASGADKLAEIWARKNCVPWLTCPADWVTHGRSAGPIRNKQMLDWKPDLVVAFPGGKGTQSMVGLAIGVGVEICDVRKGVVKKL